MEFTLSAPGTAARRHLIRAATLAASVAATLVIAAPATARTASGFVPGSLLVSSSQYQTADVMPGQTLPVGCRATSDFGGVTCATAAFDGTYPTVFNNAPIDPSFGITSPIILNQLTPGGSPLGRIEVPTRNLVTSFSSKSELALNFDASGHNLTFMGYRAPVDAIDVSNSNTPGVLDPSNPVPQSYYRAVADLNRDGRFTYTDTNAYSGNNGRAAILDDRTNKIYAAGNAGNGTSPEPDGVILGAGAQIFPAGHAPLNPPAPFGSFNVTQLNNPTQDPPDKTGKDTNFRGLRIYHDVVYLTKGSGGNGIDTVYFVDTTGKACPGTGVGVPQPGAPMPSDIPQTPSELANLQADGVTPYNMCILRGFPTISQKSKSPKPPANTPFGLFFANPTTLYVADEGDGNTTFDPTTNTYTDAAAQTIAGLEKWVFDGANWKLAYTLDHGLDLGQPYTISGYPSGTNAATGLPWSPATDGLRNLAGQVHRDGTVTVYAVTSTVSGSGDQGADPNRVVAITDNLAARTLPGAESFRTVDRAGSRQVLRGVAIVPAGFAGHR